MKKIFIRSCTLIIASIMIITTFVSCKIGEEKNQNTSAPTSDTTPVTTVDKLPDLNYNGSKIRVYTWTGTEEWVMETTNSTSAIDQQSYLHLSSVESRLNVKFEIASAVEGGWGKHSTFVETLYNTIYAGGSEYDLVCQYSYSAALGVIKGVYSNLNSFDYFDDWSGEYWNKDLIESNTIRNKIYYVTGDMTNTTIRNVGLMVYNRTLANNYNIENLYNLVKDGTWTIEKLRSIVVDKYTDLDQSQSENNKDFYGLIVPGDNIIDFFQYGGNVRCIDVDAFGEWIFSPNYYGPRGIALSEQLSTLIHRTQGTFLSYPTANYDMFLNGQGIFQAMTTDKIITGLSKAEIDYGILPIPKYDTEQSQYYTTLGATFSMFSIPIDAPDGNMVSAVIEAMESRGYNVMTPYLFDTALKSRYAKTQEDSEIFDYIMSGIIYEPGRISTTINTFSLMRRAVRDDISWTQWYAQNKNMIETNLSNLIFALS